MKKMFGKFFFELGEWFADVADHIRLLSVENEIKCLNEELEEAPSECGWDSTQYRHKLLVELEMCSDCYNEILEKVRVREERHQKATAA